MPTAAFPSLDPQQETAIIDAIIALGWNTDVVEKPLGIIQSHLGFEGEQAIALFLNFHQRKLMICKPEL